MYYNQYHYGDRRIGGFGRVRPFGFRPYGFGLPFLAGAALGASLYNPYYYPYPYY